MLKIYTAQDPDMYLSSATGWNPFRVTLDGRDTSSLEKKLFVRNDDTSKYYTDVTLDILDKGGDIFANESHGFNWKMQAGDKQPLPAEWVLLPAVSTLAFPSIGTSTLANIFTYYSFWVRVELPRGHRALSIKSVILRLSAKEYLVDV